MSLRYKQAYFVATEHIFRLGFVSKLLNFVFGPIARPKGGSSLDAVRKMMDHFRKGHSVCLFAEGEATWDGQTHPVFPATGKLVRMSGATLVTYRIEGGYLSLPRWTAKARRGAVHAHAVNVYPPEMLKKMTASEINAAIEKDLSEDAFRRQKEHPVSYRSKAPAEHLERLFYLCPRCRKIGTIHSEKDRLFCSCGLKTRFTDLGFFDPAVSFEGSPAFETVLQWDLWQKEELKRRYAQEFSHESRESLFSDASLQFNRVTAAHETVSLGTVPIVLYPDRLKLGGREFLLQEISDMAMVQAHRLLFTAKNDYYEVVSPKKGCINLRKYLDLWQAARSVI